MRRAFSAVLITLLLPFACLAQTQTGIYAHGAFDAKTFDTINIGNLNVYFNLPVFSKSGRGIGLYYNLAYNSSIWTPASSGGSKTWTPVLNWGWTAETDAHTGFNSYQILRASTCLYGGHKVMYEVWGDFAYHDTLGVVHDFPGLETTNNPTCAGLPYSESVTAADSSGYTATASSGPAITIAARDGRVISAPNLSMTGAGSTIDNNGNMISVNSSGQIIDTTGNVALTASGTAPSPTTYTYTDTNGTQRSITVNYSSYTVQTAFGCSGVSEFGPTSEYLISSVSYPDGSSYSFSYEPTPGVPGDITGRLASVTLPQGGVIQYSYSGGSNGIECADGGTATLTRSMPSDPLNPSTSYRRTPGTNSSHTEVVDGLSNYAEYDFVNDPKDPDLTSYPVDYKQYQGTNSGTPLLDRQTCYNGAAPSCTMQSLARPITQMDTYETLNGIQERGSTFKYNIYGLQTEEDDYDFGGASQRGSILRIETWTYPSSGIPNLLESDVVYDSHDSISSETAYRYDETTPVASSGVPQHESVSGQRGNLTSLVKYSNSGTSYITTYTYEDTGSVLTSVIPTASAGATSTLSYDSSFVYNTGAQFPTPSSGVALSASQSFDQSYTGLPVTSTDPNGQPTTIKSYDFLLRPTEIDDPDSGKTTFGYTPTQLSQFIYQNGSIFQDTEILYDSYGRLSRVAVKNGQGTNPWYQQDTCYDADGRISFIPYRYQGNGWGTSKVCSGAGDSYAYDALGRLTSVTHGDNTSVQYNYWGRTLKTTDENGVSKLTQIDGVGRATAVCEVTSNSFQGDSPTDCSMDISGTGFLTTYAYAAGQTIVTQGAQKRIFQTDWLGRPTSVQEPESGTTTYTYSFNSTGPVVTRTRPRANQANPSVTTTTTTQYDALGRVLSITYNDGTPTKEFSYDANAGWGTTQNNLKGRLSVASVFDPSQITGSAFSYDAMGRITSMWECLPSGCGNHSLDKGLGYTYDWAGNMLTSSDGAGVTATYTYSLAAEVDQITSSLNDAKHPGTLLSTVQNGPDGPSSWQLGNGLYGVRSYDSLGRNNGGWVCSGTNQPYCNGGGQTYGYTVAWSGARATSTCDTVLNRCSSYGYDDFNRIASQTVTSGSPDNFTYLYDRYGNRWQQNVTGGSGPSPQLSFNKSTNQITSSGYTYDAAGNLISDGTHTYTYDAEGNVIQVDGGAVKYTYNALNERVRIDQSGSDSQEFVFNASGQRVSIWDPQAGWEDQGQNYWGSIPIEYYQDGYAQFQHQDWEGTERARSTYSGSLDGSFISLPFGDGYSVSGNDNDAHHFAMLDRDAYSDTDHAQFRQFENTQGRWMSPDPYSGSYDVNNPQSMNRYSYALNNPLSFIDPSGLDEDSSDGTNDDGGDCLYDDPCGGAAPTPGADGGDDGGGSDGGSWPGQDSGFGDPNDPGRGSGSPCDGPNDPSCGNPPPAPDPCTLWFTCEPGVPASSGFGGGGGGGSAPNKGATCQLLAPGGHYNVGPNAVALFQPPMATALTNAFDSLNSQGITPLINSGYRSPADQMRMRNGGSGPNPAAVVSPHEVGMAVDINGTSSSFFPAIINAMQAQGLFWGGNFTHRDPPHFQLLKPGTRPSAAMVNACAAAAGGHS